MSTSGLTSEAQLRYISEWFREFSELQREDFLPILAAAHSDQPDQLAASVASLTCEDKPVSLFQCRIKLFNSWFPNWATEEKDRLIKTVSEIDSEFGSKLQDAMTNGSQMNGNADNSVFQNDPSAPEIEDEAIASEHTESLPVSSEPINVEIVAAS